MNTADELAVTSIELARANRRLNALDSKLIEIQRACQKKGHDVKTIQDIIDLIPQKKEGKESEEEAESITQKAGCE